MPASVIALHVQWASTVTLNEIICLLVIIWLQTISERPT